MGTVAARGQGWGWGQGLGIGIGDRDRDRQRDEDGEGSGRGAAREPTDPPAARGGLEAASSPACLVGALIPH